MNASNFPEQSVITDVDLEYRPDNFALSNAAERDLLLSLLNPQSNEELYNFYTTGPINYTIPNVGYTPNPNLTTPVPLNYYNPNYPVKSEPGQQYSYTTSPPLTPSDASTPISTSTKSGKRKTPEERELARAEQQKLASRRYRQKKKVLVDQLESKLAELMKEKEKIEKAHQETLQIVNKLKEENDNLKNATTKASGQVEEKRIVLLSRLEKLYKENAPDSELQAVFDEMDQCCKRLSILGEQQSQMLINPTLVSQLVKAGFFEGKDEAVMSLERQASIEVFYQKVLDNIHDLTSHQKEQMLIVVEKYDQDIKILINEKEQLNKEIILHFKQATEIKQDMANLIQTVSTLELLRKNVTEEVKRTEKALEDILDCLTVRQKTHFLLNVEFWYASVLKLKSMWDAFAKKSLGLMSNAETTNTTNTCPY